MTEKLSSNEALERIFEVIRQEATANPSFARRMLDASGITVVFQGTEAAKMVDPIVQAARQEYADFRESFLTFSERDLKAILKGYALATDEQVKAVKSKPKHGGLVDLLWEGARRKLDQRKGR